MSALAEHEYEAVTSVFVRRQPVPGARTLIPAGSAVISSKGRSALFACLAVTAILLAALTGWLAPLEQRTVRGPTAELTRQVSAPSPVQPVAVPLHDNGGAEASRPLATKRASRSKPSRMHAATARRGGAVRRVQLRGTR